MKLVIVIVSYNVRYYVEQCLRSVRKALHDIDAEVYVIDNHSKDGTVDYLRPLFPEVKFIAGKHNIGFARANNIVIRRSRSEYVLLLNPDTIVGEDVLRQCITAMDAHPETGALGVCMRNSCGQRAMESRRGLPTPMTAFYKMCGLCARYPHSRRFGKYYMSYLPWDEPAQIEVVSGAFCMLRREAIDKVGALDEDYFMYGEDIDLSYRLLKAGYTNRYLPVEILHYKGESTVKTSFRYVHVFYQAMFIFFRKHYGHMRLWITLPVKIAIYAKATMALCGMMTEKTRKSLGFAVLKQEKRQEYVFIVSDNAVGECRRIAMDNGLTALFVDADSQAAGNGHATIASLANNGCTVHVIYDTSLFDYSQILSFFTERPDDNIRLGTYHPESRIVITDREVFK